MRIDATVKSTKTVRGRINGATAIFGDLQTWADTKETASQQLMTRVEFRSTYESTRVETEVCNGHIGVFSYGLDGFVDTRHIYPNDNRVSKMCGSKSIGEAKDSFRYHVAQLTWDGESEYPVGVKVTEAQCSEFRSWVRFQKAYKYAHETLNMTDVQSHAWACDGRNVIPVAA